MRSTWRWIIRRIFHWAGCAFIIIASATCLQAEQFSSKIMSRPEMSAEKRQELAVKLRSITGWPELDFDDGGTLSLGQAQPAGGSATARALLSEAVNGKNLIVLEDSGDRADVVFCRVVEGRWKRGGEAKPPVYVILIDFSDFSRVFGDAPARSAFNVAWGVLHEIDHVVHESADPAQMGDAGACESLINRMRRECGLAERTDYFFTALPGGESSSFKSRYVRLAFIARQPKRKQKQYWLVWDADQVGGLPANRQLALAK